MLQAIGVVPMIPQTIGGPAQPSIAPVTIPNQQSQAHTGVPRVNQETIMVPAATTAATDDLERLTEDEIIVLITHHRGHSRGLHSLSRDWLLTLLNYHEVSSILLAKNVH